LGSAALPQATAIASPAVMKILSFQDISSLIRIIINKKITTAKVQI
jgi:hypothetical protein